MDTEAIVDKQYNTALSQSTRDYLQAFADGLNYYVAKHNVKPAIAMPITAKDIVAGYMVRHILFYGFDETVAKLFSESSAVTDSVTDANTDNGASGYASLFNNLPIGSNAIAVAPHRSDDGATRLAINAHQPLTGPVAWYEGHIKSGTGLDVMGGIFLGSPTIGVGFNKNLAWGATVNKPDLVDVYRLTIDPENSMRYKFDGGWRELEVRKVKIQVKLWGFLPWTVTRKALRSEHGPVLETPSGTYALRFAGMNEIRQVEQWVAMNKAQNFEQWKDSMKMQSFPSFNFVYADKEQNIYYVHNSKTPVRTADANWQAILPGDDSNLIWNEYLPYSQLPQITNPKSGFLLSVNQSPFYITAGEGKLDSADYSPKSGFDPRMNNRSLRGLELFSDKKHVSAQQFYDIKHDKSYSPNWYKVKYMRSVVALELDSSLDKVYHQAQTTLQQWDLSTTINNTNAAMGVCVMSRVNPKVISVAQQERNVPILIDNVKGVGVLKQCADLIVKATGVVNPKWGTVNRHVRGELNLPVGGGPDTLRAIYGSGIVKDGFNTNVAGDGLYYLVEWDADGVQKVRGVHQFGSAPLDVDSVHYGDQAEDYVNEVLHDPLFDSGKRASKIERRYRP